jgi:hypothetical protein
MKSVAIISVIIFASTLVHAQADTTKTNQRKFSFEKTKNQRYLSTDEIGTLIGLAGNSAGKIFFSYQTVNSWQFDRHIYFGPGTGLEVTGGKNILLNEGNSKSAIMIPMFAEIRACVLSKRVSPYFSDKAGYTFYLATPKPGLIGGGFIETQVGIKAFITKNASFNLSVGYRLQCLSVPSVYASQFGDMANIPAGESQSSKTIEYFHFLSIHAGFCY